jgi:PAS domain S-box-containing protein
MLLIKRDGILFQEPVQTHDRSDHRDRLRIWLQHMNIINPEFGFMELSARDEFRSLVFETSPLAMVVMDAETLRFIDCNPAAVAIYGYASKHEFLGKTLIDLSAACQYDGVKPIDKCAEYVRQALQSGSVVFDWRHQRPDGEIWDGQIRLLSLAIPDRNLLHFSLVDISSRRRAEQLQRLQHELILALNACSDLGQGVNLVLQSVLSLDGIDCGVVYVADSRDGSLRIAASEGLSPQFLSGIDQLTADSPAAQMAARGEMSFGSYAEHHPHADDASVQEGLRGVALVPVMFNNALIALMALASRKTEQIPAATVTALDSIALQTSTTLRRLQSEGALRESEAIFQHFLENSPVYVFVKDQDLKPIRLSSNYEKLMRRPIGDVLGKRAEEVFSPEQAAAVNRGEHAILTGGKVVTMDGILDGRYYTTIKFPINIAGKPRYLAGYAIDITDRKKADEALQETTAQFREFMNNMPSMAVIKDEKLRPIFFNRAMLDAFPAQDWLGKTPHEAFPAQLADEIVQADSQALLEGSRVYEEERIDKNGRLRLLETKRFAIQRAGAPSYLAAIITDITDKKRSEALLQNAQKLDSLGVMAGGIAHDFNNLLSGIFGYLELARIGETIEARNVCITRALSAMERARDLTRQMLTFAKGGNPVKKVGSLMPFLQNSVEFALSGASVDFRLDVPADLWFCDYDKNQMGQTIDNIVINAVQAMPAGGTIEVLARNVTLAADQHAVLPAGGYVRISIIDHGIGIPQEYLLRVFDPFFTTKPKGHGLGLATCYSILKRHDGSIEVESEPGKGTTFHLFLPAVSESQAEASTFLSAQHRGEGIFLIMEDEEVVRTMLTWHLERFGYTVVSFSNGSETLEYYAEACRKGTSVAGMIFDLTIPGAMGGEETIREIRKLDSHVPVFVASGYADDPVIALPQQYGFTGSLAKPFTSKELSELLNRHLPASE